VAGERRKLVRRRYDGVTTHLKDADPAELSAVSFEAVDVAPY
jgi:hypothetical protein